MIQTIEKRQENRWLMLHQFYEITGGRLNRIVDIWEVGNFLGWDRDITATTFDYLLGEGLLEAMTLGGGASITHQGVKEVEAAMEHPGKPTLHFPSSVVNFNKTIMNNTYNQNNVGIGHASGGEFQGNTVVGTIQEVSSPSDAASEARELLASEVRELLTQIEKAYPANTTTEQMVIATETIKRIEANPAWKQRIVNALKEGSMAAFEKAVNKPIGAFIKGAFEGWRDAE
jgi:hypothetical protein